jgi:hypothetical protein
MDVVYQSTDARSDALHAFVLFAPAIVASRSSAISLPTRPAAQSRAPCVDFRRSQRSDSLAGGVPADDFRLRCYEMKAIVTATVFIGLGLTAFAQNPNQRTPPPSQQQQPTEQNDPAAGAPMTVTGCLVKGASAAEYSITDKQSGEKLSFSAPDTLQRYVNQTVQLNGTVMNKGGEKAFRPETVKSVSSTC